MEILWDNMRELKLLLSCHVCCVYNHKLRFLISEIICHSQQQSIIFSLALRVWHEMRLIREVSRLMPSSSDVFFAGVVFGEVPAVVFIDYLLLEEGRMESDAVFFALVKVVESWELVATVFS